MIKDSVEKIVLLWLVHYCFVLFFGAVLQHRELLSMAEGLKNISLKIFCSGLKNLLSMRFIQKLMYIFDLKYIKYFHWSYWLQKFSIEKRTPWNLQRKFTKVEEGQIRCKIKNIVKYQVYYIIFFLWVFILHIICLQNQYVVILPCIQVQGKNLKF
mgnify:FL=1